MFGSYCGGIPCLCATCINSVENIHVSPNERMEPCFVCDECYNYDHNREKRSKDNSDCRYYIVADYYVKKGVIE